jgi:DNA-nicking Smr family endonuclease
MGKKYKVSPKDLEQWQEEIKSVRKLANKKVVRDDMPDPKAVGVQLKQISRRYIAESTGLDHRLAGDGVVNHRSARKMDTGKYEVDAVLDLHGQTEEQACSRFCEFIKRGFEERKRMLLVITGKGRKSPDRQAVLREALHKWVNYPEVKSCILRFSHAAARHGGMGAYYILLKGKG